jgi:hypothetical protein
MIHIANAIHKEHCQVEQAEDVSELCYEGREYCKLHLHDRR